MNRARMAGGIGPAGMGLLALGALFSARAGAQETDCAGCHAKQAQEHAASVHHRSVRCQECHGGHDLYALRPEQWQVYVRSGASDAAVEDTRPAFDHGDVFRGISPRSRIPFLCGTCHADVAQMNPYGLRTDQLAAYWTSGHGQRLKQHGDERVAVCTDCHGTHDVLRADSPLSRTHFRNVPDTCARCHADRDLMALYGLSADVVGQYRASVHGRYVLELADAAAPHCATCHGSHAATPPGFAAVGHVCGQCHAQIEEYFLEGTHGRIPAMPRCIGCHGHGGDIRNHRIEEASPPPDALQPLWARLLDEADGQAGLRARFDARVERLAGSLRLENTCRYCHASERIGPHARFFRETDRLAHDRGVELAGMLREAQFRYVQIAQRVDRVARGVLLVRDEALAAQEVKTELQALYAYLHTLDPVGIAERVDKIKELSETISASLDAKERGLAWRRWSLALVWGWAAVGAGLMFRKYLLLKKAYIKNGPAGAAQPAAPDRGAWPTRRRMLDVAVSVFGSVSVMALLWPAVAYCLPVRKRGGGRQRVSLGSEEGFGVWEGRKVSVSGKPVVVLRTTTEFRAFSAVCTHLACLVHWNQPRREFGCPCHAARFDAEGQVLAGPPPAPLPKYNVSVVQGEVIVTGTAS